MANPQLPYLLRAPAVKKLTAPGSPLKSPTKVSQSDPSSASKAMATNGNRSKPSSASDAADTETEPSSSLKRYESLVERGNLLVGEIQRQLLHTEYTYHEDTPHGNLYKGWELYLDARVGDKPLTRRKMDFTRDRWFSGSCSVEGARSELIGCDVPYGGEEFSLGEKKSDEGSASEKAKKSATNTDEAGGAGGEAKASKGEKTENSDKTENADNTDEADKADKKRKREEEADSRRKKK